MEAAPGSSKRIILQGDETTDDEMGYDSNVDDVELDGASFFCDL